uniref:Secreted RxLR effector protein 15 n=1 Tax=Plasmopara viticola TaxID=143451 RepID=RLR15_PLAVT|nr:RecName: Full=Secreted RxLR effector protein 15; Flags: Precursor [Plasmopara viticola]
MRGHSALMMAVVTLAAVSSGAAEVANTAAVSSDYLIGTILTFAESDRLLRVNDVDDVPVYHYPPEKGKRTTFFEDRMKKKLANPEKIRRLYWKWYSMGYSAREVVQHLDQTDNRELKEIYHNLGVGYAEFVAKMNV